MKLSQRTRILILLALIVAAVAVWYSLFFAGNQQNEVAAYSPPATTQANTEKPARSEKKPVAVTTSARALQVLPIPFLVTEAPEEAPLKPEEPQPQAAVAAATVPPNPFVPLKVDVAKQPAKPKEVPESKEPVLVTPEGGLANNIPVPKTITPDSNVAAPPPPVSANQGALPIKLSPLAREVSGSEPLSGVVADSGALINVKPVVVAEEPGPAEVVEVVPEPEDEIAATGTTDDTEFKPEVVEAEVSGVATGSAGQPAQTTTYSGSSSNPLVAWAKQQKLRLDGVALGPVGVAIFETASGYLALPVGQTFPDKDVLVKTITAERVLLVDSSGTNTLTLELGGGE